MQKQADKDKKRLKDIKDKLRETEKYLKIAESKVENIPLLNKLELEKVLSCDRESSFRFLYPPPPYK